MAVYFVYRSHYEGPTGKYIKRFKDASVLDWFRRHWRPVADPLAVNKQVEKMLGCSVYGLGSLFEAIGERAFKPPKNTEELEEYLRVHLYVEGEILFTPHAIQVLTDDDELQLAYYFFDDHFLAEHVDRAAYLLHGDWRLPNGAGVGGFEPAVATRELASADLSEGTTYGVFLAFYDSGNLDDLEGAIRIDGVRVPDLARYFAGVHPGKGWPRELLLLRSQLFATPEAAIRSQKGFLDALMERPSEDAGWKIYSDWLEEHGQRQPGLVLLERALTGTSQLPFMALTNEGSWPQLGRGTLASARQKLEGIIKKLHSVGNHDPSKSLIHVGEHLAQLCLHTNRWGITDLFHQWIFFDDLWASANPVLANAILRFASRWDVLS
jgi:uncharacterized protein (TIGR02996 family)